MVPVNFQGNYYHIENGRLNTPFVAADRTGPEIFLGGSSPQAFGLAARHADCLWTLPRRPEELATRIKAVLESGTEVGILVSMIARPSRKEALSAAQAMLAEVGDRARKTHQDFCPYFRFRGIYQHAGVGGGESVRLADRLALDRCRALPGRAGDRAGRILRRSHGGYP